MEPGFPGTTLQPERSKLSLSPKSLCRERESCWAQINFATTGAYPARAGSPPQNSSGSWVSLLAMEPLLQPLASLRVKNTPSLPPTPRFHLSPSLFASSSGLSLTLTSAYNILPPFSLGLKAAFSRKPSLTPLDRGCVSIYLPPAPYCSFYTSGEKHKCVCNTRLQRWTLSSTGDRLPGAVLKWSPPL